MKALQFFLLLLAVAAPLAAQTQPQQHSTSDLLTNKVIVKFTRDAAQSGISPQLLGPAVAEFGISSVGPWLNPKLVKWRMPLYKTSNQTQEAGLLRIAVVRYSAAIPPRHVAQALAKLPGVEYAEPISRPRLLRTPNDPSIPDQWYLEQISAFDAWDSVQGDSTLLIAISDTGIEPDHEDLAAAMWKNPGENGTDNEGKEKSTNGKDDDGNGYVDDWRGYDFAGYDGLHPDNNPSPAGESHGTEAAGIAAAVGNNDRGIAGVAYGATLMSLKIATDGTSPDLIGGYESILYAAKMGARVINCSWGDIVRSQAEQEVIDVVTNTYKSLVVVAAGNNGLETPMYPASYRGALSVAATDEQDKRASFSRYNYYVDLAAPGTRLLTTDLGNSYRRDDGTSFACPIVAGAAALVMKKYPELNPEQVSEVLRASCDDITPLLPPQLANKFGAGRLNLYRAVTQGPAIRSARMMGYTLNDQSGDGIADAGEQVSIQLTVKNLLAPTDSLAVTMEQANYPLLVVGNNRVRFDALATGATATSPNGNFTFTVPADMPANSELVLKVSTITLDRTNYDYITLQISPTYQTTNLNTISATFNSTGNIAYNGLNRTQGDGFTYQTSRRLLFHGGLVMGTDANHVADVVRVGGLSQGTAQGFQMVKPYRLTVASDSSVQTGYALFNDSAMLTQSRIGVEVAMTTTEYRKTELDNVVIVSYRLKNTSGAAITNLHCGLYLDWDIGIDGLGDVVGYDPDSRLGYQQNPGMGEQKLLAGAAILDGNGDNFYAINNDDQENGVQIDFNPAKKWGKISGGLARTLSDPGDGSMMIAAGPIAIAAGDSTTVAFALLAANDFQTLRQSVARAKVAYNGSSSAPAELPDSFTKLQAFPNPARGIVTIQWGNGVQGSAVVALHNLIGQTIMQIPVAAGVQQVQLPLQGVAPGMYQVMVSAGNQRAVQSFVVQ
ncbi:MAG: S8 family serine peptidase [Armatimonadetes bacterium]|nr:S8 family serine peptidase [Armatimonadota bacterium]